MSIYPHLTVHHCVKFERSSHNKNKTANMHWVMNKITFVFMCKG